MVRKIKTMDKDMISKLQALENELGYCLIALEQTSDQDDILASLVEYQVLVQEKHKLASLSKEQLEDLHKLEARLLAVLIAYIC